MKSAIVIVAMSLLVSCAQRMPPASQPAANREGAQLALPQITFIWVTEKAVTFYSKSNMLAVYEDMADVDKALLQYRNLGQLVDGQFEIHSPGLIDDIALSITRQSPLDKRVDHLIASLKALGITDFVAISD